MAGGGDEMRAALLGMSARKLTKRAEQLGIDEAKLLEADEAADRKRALADLILQQESMPQKRDREESENGGDDDAALRAELSSMPARALMKRAEELAVDEKKLEEADDAPDRKAALIGLILQQHQVEKSRLRDELSAPSMTPRLLARRAQEMGIGMQEIGKADGHVDRKGALVALILRHDSKFRAKLSRLTPLELVVEAEAMGIDEGALDAADQAENRKGELMNLLIIGAAKKAAAPLKPTKAIKKKKHVTKSSPATAAGAGAAALGESTAAVADGQAKAAGAVLCVEGAGSAESNGYYKKFGAPASLPL